MWRGSGKEKFDFSNVIIKLNNNFITYILYILYNFIA